MQAQDLQAEIIRLRAENDALKAKASKRQALSVKVSEKGAVSVYGLGRFPVTLYREQWARVFGHKTEIESFITANAASLKSKE